MIWDAVDRRYEDNQGRPIAPAQVRKVINDYIIREQALISKAAQRLVAGEITPEAFFAFMQSKVTAWHQITGTIAYGGEDQLNLIRQARINTRILSELGYLAEFQTEAQASFTAAEIIANKVSITVAKDFPQAQAEIRQRVGRALFTAAPSEAATVARKTVIEVVGAEIPIAVGPEGGFLIGGQIQNRTSMYPEAMYGTYENNILSREGDSGVTMGRRVLEDGDNCEDCIAWATEEFRPLDELEEIGSSVCGSRCKCEFEFGDSDSSFRTSEIFSGVISGQERYGGDVELN